MKTILHLKSLTAAGIPRFDGTHISHPSFYKERLFFTHISSFHRGTYFLPFSKKTSGGTVIDGETRFRS